jgi:excisionase family DNA binding protein
VTELTVRRHIKAGKLHAVQIGGSWRIPCADRERLEELPLECSLHQVANCLDVSSLTVRRWIKSNQLSATKLNRVWVIKRDELEAILGLEASDENSDDAVPSESASLSVAKPHFICDVAQGAAERRDVTRPQRTPSVRLGRPVLSITEPYESPVQPDSDWNTEHVGSVAQKTQRFA